MTTTLDVVKAALRKVGGLGSGEEVEATLAAEALFSLNAMMHGWAARGVDTNHSDLELSDVFPLADRFVSGTVFLLAREISSDYAFPVSFDADDWFRTLQAAYWTAPELTVPAALTRPPSREDRDGNLPVIES